MNPFPTRDIWPPDTVVDRKYIIRSKIGEGGFATAYLASHSVFGYSRVIKRLHSQHAGDPQFAGKFVEEARTIEQLNGCPQIVKVFDMTQTDDGHLILVMEYMPGGDLGKLIKKEGRLSVRDTIQYAQQIAEGLKAAHAAGFVHRDVKPANVLLGADPKVVKLADFGIAADRDPDRPTSVYRTGSVGFAPLEQWKSGGKHLDGRTDLYALGATMYFMLAGRMPYGELDYDNWVSAIQAGPPPSLRTIVSSVSKGLDGLVLDMLEVDRENRPKDADEVLARLQDCLTPKPPQPAPKPPEPAVEKPRPTPPDPLYTPTVLVPKPGPGPEIPRRPQKWPLIVGSALVVVLAGALVYRAVNGKPVAKGTAEGPTAPQISGAAGPSTAQTPGPAGTAGPSTGTEAGRAAAQPAARTAEHKEVTTPSAAQTSGLPQGQRAGETYRNPKDGLTYVWIPPGTFQMGCSQGDGECSDNEKPAHEVTLTKGFWMGQTEVTQEAYRRVIGSNPSHFKTDPHNPVEQVPWKEAQSYCEKAGMRLPTEAEWEYAARGGPGSTPSRYGALDDIAWYDEKGGSTTHPVGQKQANKFELYDMLGNVWEWVSDFYVDKEKYPAGPQTDPIGPASGPYHVLRGGSWYNGARYARVSFRLGLEPEVRSNGIGLRCAGN